MATIGIVVTAFVAAVVLGLVAERVWRALSTWGKKVSDGTKLFLVKLRWIAITAAIIAAVMLGVYRNNVDAGP